MGVVNEWNSGKGLGDKCAWSDTLGERFQEQAGSFVKNPEDAENLLASHLGPLELKRIQEIESPVLGKITFFAYTPK